MVGETTTVVRRWIAQGKQHREHNNTTSLGAARNSAEMLVESCIVHLWRVPIKRPYRHAMVKCQTLSARSSGEASQGEARAGLRLYDLILLLTKLLGALVQQCAAHACATRLLLTPRRCRRSQRKSWNRCWSCRLRSHCCCCPSLRQALRQRVQGLPQERVQVQQP